MGAIMTIMLTGEEGGGTWSLIEYTAPPHFPGPPPHVHDDTQESFYVLDGTMGFVIDGRTLTAPSRSLVVVPPRTVHTFFNPTAEPATYLAWFSPAGAEHVSEELAAIVATEPIWPPADRHRLSALWNRHRSVLAGIDHAAPLSTTLG
jgi:mannose-6-phosphate isomerase-like protein (cupin superfamily)